MEITPKTAREALMVELLGDMDDILDRVENAPRLINEAGEQAASKITASADDFNSDVVTNIDIFIGKSNEVLSAFITKTEALKKVVAELNINNEQATEPKTLPVKEKTKNSAALFWMLPTMFFVGFSVGLIFNTLFFK